MMKRLLLILLSVMISSFCFAETYKSNILMQKLQNSSDSEYVLRVNGNTDELYLKGELIKTRITSVKKDFDSVNTTVEINDLKLNTNEVYTYRNGLITEYSFDSSDSHFDTYFNYDDENLLIFTSTVEENREPEVVFYLRDNQTGKILGTKRTDSYNWNNENYLVENDLILTEVADGLYVENEFNLNDDGTISYSHDGIDYKYSVTGQLLEESAGNSTVRYYYKEGKLDYSESVSGTKKTVSYYSNGIIINSVSYDNDILTESAVYNISGMVKTLYSNEVPLVEIVYDKTGMKVESIRYLN